MSVTGRRLGMAVTTLALTLTTTAAGAMHATAATKPKAVVLRLGVTDAIDSLNPYSGVTLAAYEAWTLVYDSLLNLSPDGLTSIPELASSVPKAGADGLTWTYHLRHDVRWSDGTPFTADDVVYTLTRMRDEEWPNFTTFVSGFTSITAPDKYTVVIKTDKPDPRMPYIPAYIIQKKQWSAVSKNDLGTFANTSMIGTGPFLLQRFKKGQFTKFTANKRYFGGAPRIDGITLQVFGNDDAMVGALENGEIDASSEVPTARFKDVQHARGITAVEADDGSFNMLTLNTGSGPVGNGHPALQDKRVRVAIAHAIDKQTLLDQVLMGYGKIGQSMNVALAPRWNLVPVANPYKFDIALANRMLDDAGYRDTNNDGVREMPGGGRALKFRYDIRSSSMLDAPVARFIKGWMKQIGIAVDVSTVTETQLTAIENAGTFDLATWAWTPFTDPDAQLSYLTCAQVPQEPDDGSYNDAFYCSKEYDKLYDRQRAELDETKRIAEVKQMQQIFYDDAPYVVLYRASALQAYNHDRFTGFTAVPDPDGPIMLANDFLNYSNVRPASGGGGGARTVALIVIGVVIGLGIITALVVLMRRRRSYSGGP
jgi:peptide/nickel transport system substrate-binding protein